MQNIPLFKPCIGEDELAALAETFRSGWVGLGPHTQEFEKAFASYIGTKYALGTNSATAALHLSLAVHDLKGFEVISPSFTFISTNHAILYNEAVPVFGDIEPDTLCLDPEDVKEKITPKTKAMITVHYAGHPSNMKELCEIAEDYHLLLIEDAAHATGASYRGVKVGALGDIACFSFQALKNLTTGEGGMITTNDNEIVEKLRKLRWMGINKDTLSRSGVDEYSWYYEVEYLGHKCHMNDIPATIGLIQLQKLDDHLNRRRREIADYYNTRLGKLDWITTPVEHDDVDRVYCLYVIQVEKRDELIRFLQENGISTGVHYYPNHLHPFYRELIDKGKVPQPRLPITERVWKNILDLPLFVDLTDEQLDYICTKIEEFETAYVK